MRIEKSSLRKQPANPIQKSSMGHGFYHIPVNSLRCKSSMTRPVGGAQSGGKPNYIYNEDGTVAQPDRKTRLQSRIMRVQSINNVIVAIIHSLDCAQADCATKGCMKCKKLFRHMEVCEVSSSRACPICSQMIQLLSYHLDRIQKTKGMQSRSEPVVKVFRSIIKWRRQKNCTTGTGHGGFNTIQ